jgi:iron complex transport system substrate-binding protein
MRIVSLLPAATEILLALGLEGELVGITHECEVPAGAGEPVVLTAPGQEGGSLDAAALAGLEPDLVVVGRGDDGTVGARTVQATFAGGAAEPSILTLAPSSIEGVLNGIVAVGAMTEAEDEAIGLVEELRERLKGLEEIVVGRRDHGFPPTRVVFLTAVDPPQASGRWIPEQVRLAGGWELLGQEGERPTTTSWAAVHDMDPEVLVVLPGDLPLDGAARAWEASPRPEGWTDLRAVRDDRVFVVDGGPFLRPGPRIVDGVEILAELIDPAAFDGMSPPATWARAR